MATWTKINKSQLINRHYDTTKDLYLYLDFIEKNDIVSCNNGFFYGTTIKRFLENGGKGCGKNYINIKNYFPSEVMDHITIFRKTNNDVIITSQPYKNEEHIKEAFANHECLSYCDIKIFDTSKSWHNPGKTTLFTITLKNVAVK